MSSPFTAIGRVESDVRGLENAMHNKADKYEVSNLKSEVSRLEGELTAATNDISYLKQRVEALENKAQENTPT